MALEGRKGFCGVVSELLLLYYLGILIFGGGGGGLGLVWLLGELAGWLDGYLWRLYR